MNKSIRRAVVAAVFVSLLMGVVGCKNEEKAVEGKSEVMTMRYVDLKVYDPVYVAIEKGFFEKRGLKVELFGDSLGGPTAIQAVSAGQIEAGLSSFPAIINARAAGLPITGVSDIQSAIGDQALEEFFVRSDSGIGSIQDLKGKRVAVNLMKSSFHYTILMAMERAGLKDDDVTFVLLPFDQQETALANDQVDMIGLMEPYASHARDIMGDDIKLLFNALDVFGEKQFTTHFVNTVWAESHQAEATAFVSGIADAVEWIEANPDDAKPIISKYTKVEEKYIPDYKFQRDGQVNMEDAAFWLDYLRGRGDVKVDWLKPEDFASNKFNDRLQ